MTEKSLIEFHDSFDRCMKDGRFFDLFYDRFLHSSPEVAEKFRNTDFAVQKVALRRSLYSIIDAAARFIPDYSLLSAIAERHSRKRLDIRLELYVLWLDALIQTAADCDPRFTDKIAETWREVFQSAINYIVSTY